MVDSMRLGDFWPGWKMALFVAFFLPVTITLGFWQLDRAAQKQQMANAYLNQLTELPKPATRDVLNKPFSRVRLTGHFSGPVFLVDNQVLEGKQGYWIVQLFEDQNHGRFLVNRGFVAGLERKLPKVPVVGHDGQAMKIVGMVWPFTGLIPVLDEDSWSAKWPKRIQRLDIRRMADFVEAKHVEIRLEPGQPGVGKAAPFAGVLKSDMHMGYAATWFGLALALVLCVIAFLVIKKRNPAK